VLGHLDGVKAYVEALQAELYPAFFEENDDEEVGDGKTGRAAWVTPEHRARSGAPVAWSRVPGEEGGSVWAESRPGGVLMRFC